jgi:hypothetical protein
MNTQMTDTEQIFRRQGYHLVLLLILIAIVGYICNLIPIDEGEFLGVSSSGWFWASVFAAIIHQVYTWITWRLELYKGYLSDKLGSPSFTLFKLFFAVFGISRLLIIPLAISNRETLDLPFYLQWGVSILFLILSVYLFYSVLRWFGIDRAAGLDHFKPDEARNWSLVDRGIFRFTSNGMYIFGFLFLWVPGLMLESAGAILAASFCHLYIWVHYFCTEKPDMQHIYSNR